MTTRATPLPSEIHVLVPFWGMAGGVIKILDYARHASTAGIDVRLWAPAPLSADAAIRSLPVFEVLDRSSNVTISALDDLLLDGAATPWVLFTEPAHHALIEQVVEGSLDHRLIHLIQGTRHANPTWNGGLHYRVLHRPMTRISVTDQVADAIRPHVNTRFISRTILEGHDVAYFRSGAPDRTLQRTPLRVLYTNWKSDLGDRVAATVAESPSLTFDAIDAECTWEELRRRYHAADVFLCAPGPEEGFYLPGLEAMAAGCIVVSSFVGGNEAYLVEGVNCVRTPQDDTDAHAAALIDLASDRSTHRSLIEAGWDTIKNHTLERECDAFIDLLGHLAQTDHHREVS